MTARLSQGRIDELNYATDLVVAALAVFPFEGRLTVLTHALALTIADAVPPAGYDGATAIATEQVRECLAELKEGKQI